MSRYRRTRDQHFQDPGPKRILSLDGGGLRGILTLRILGHIEVLLQDRYDDADLRLCDYFDLIAGTSTGAIVAACLATGMSVDDTADFYTGMGGDVFKKPGFLRRLTKGLVKPQYDTDRLVAGLQDAIGADTTLGSDRIHTGLLIVAKRIDTHSIWPLGNNPRGKYFNPPEYDPTVVANREYPLWQLLRASAAAPTYFSPEEVHITGWKAGQFIDGGMSPLNDPSFQALLYATLDGYNVGWETGEDRLSVVSVGTGDFGQPAGAPNIPGPIGDVFTAFFSLLDDTQIQTRVLMQLLSRSPTKQEIDSEIGDLGSDVLGGVPLISYVRYNADLSLDGVAELLPKLSVAPTADQLESLHQMDDPSNVPLLAEIGHIVGAEQVDPAHFRPQFDIEPSE